MNQCFFPCDRATNKGFSKRQKRRNGEGTKEEERCESGKGVVAKKKVMENNKY